LHISAEQASVGKGTNAMRRGQSAVADADEPRGVQS
jgi:hypothetical protein